MKDEEKRNFKNSIFANSTFPKINI